MITVKDKNKDRVVRHKRVRNAVVGTTERPRLSVYRSLSNIYAQIIDDSKGVTLASASTLDKEVAEMIKGKTIEEALKLSNKAVVEALGGLPPHKIHCSVLAEQSIKAAIADYYTRQGIDPTPFVGEIKDDHCDSCCGI